MSYAMSLILDGDLEGKRFGHRWYVVLVLTRFSGHLTVLLEGVNDVSPLLDVSFELD